MQAQEGNVCFTELAERVEYGNYGGLGREAAEAEVVGLWERGEQRLHLGLYLAFRNIIVLVSYILLVMFI